jgi:hydroxymethylpyrimidine pyrophosphatase-like HAD family hydrolase
LKITPLSVGRSIVATREPNEIAVLEAIRELGLELHIIFNKGAVMVLSANVNKTSGLAVALERMHISFRDVVGIGDAENDRAFLQRCGLAVAVDNALPSVKAMTHLVVGPCGLGIEELSRLLIETDLRDGHYGSHDGQSVD